MAVVLVGPLLDHEVLEVTIGSLSVDQLRVALAALGLHQQSVPQSLVDLLANPLNLTLFALLYEDTPAAKRPSLDLVRIRTRMDLLSRYHDHMRQKVRPQLGINGYSNAVFQLAEVMSNSGELSVPKSVLAAQPDTLGVLLHHGVLVEEASRLRFFHEAYFDYGFALHHTSLGRTAADLLQDDPQELVRRGQVRAILTLERSESPGVYVHDLRTVLGQRTRSHVRAAP